MSAEDNQGDYDREQEGEQEAEDRMVQEYYEDRMLNYIYDIRWHGLRLWDDDDTNVNDWNANAWSYAAQYDYLLDSWMIRAGPGNHNMNRFGVFRSVIWDRTGQGMQLCLVCSHTTSIFNVNRDDVSHTHYCTVSTQTSRGYNPILGNVVCSVCRTSMHSYRQGLRRPVIVTCGFLGDTVRVWLGQVGRDIT